MIGYLVVWMFFSMRNPAATSEQNTDHVESRLVKTPEAACRALRGVGTEHVVYRVVVKKSGDFALDYELERVELVCARGAK
ncbi:MAG: hypothetical protein PHS14_07695 [Elusimicrobia bacterium]|nr:hypothetical protein [Elusimicrobiota bacterium]